MSKIEVGKEYVGEDGQWYYYTEADVTKKAYEQGAKDVYYGRVSNMKQFLTADQRSAYWNGYNDEPYGRKDNGYDEE